MLIIAVAISELFEQQSSDVYALLSVEQSILQSVTRYPEKASQLQLALEFTRSNYDLSGLSGLEQGLDGVTIPRKRG